MRAEFRMTGTSRRELVHAISEITGASSEYQFVPSCAYTIGDITVDKEGGVLCDDEEKLKGVMEKLEVRGFHLETREGVPMDAEHEAAEKEELVPDPAADSGAEPEEEACPVESPVVPEQENEADTEAAREEPIEADNAAPTEEAEASALTIAMPIDAVNVGTLTNLILAKESLIRKALGITDTRIQVTGDKVLFPWFERELTTDEANAYTLFISQLCRHSKELKHASSRPVEAVNEKYAFRCFLLRLGFIGPDYKEARKILLRNLSGSAAFRNGAPLKKEHPAEEAPEEAQDTAMTEETAE